MISHCKTQEELLKELEELRLENESLKVKYNQDIAGLRLAEANIRRMCDEYKAQNDEFRSAIEKLQAANEEFAANNKELHAKEKSLNNDKIFFEALFESIPGYFYVYNDQGRLVKWNKKHEEMTGYSAEELSNMTLDKWFEGEDLIRVSAAVEEIFKTGYGEVEANLLLKGGRKLLIRSNGVPLSLDGKTYFTGVGIDITESRRVEQELKHREALFRLLAENSTDMIARHDLQGKFLYVSPVCRELVGYEPEELVGRSAFEFVHPDDIPKVDQSLEIISGQPVLSTTPFRMRCKNGEYIWLETTSRIIVDNEAGGALEIHASSRDITKRKEAEDKLHESEEKLRTLFGAMTEMVALHELVFNGQGEAVNYRITECNNAYTKITGITKENAVGKLATEVYGGESAPYLGEFSQVALTGIPYEYTSYYEPMDKYFSISVVSPKINQFATITTDVTVIQQIQAEIAAKNKELENYLFVASHDLRSPLVNIQGFSQRLQKQIDSIKAALAGRHVNEAAIAMIEKITDNDIPKTLNFIFSNVEKMDILINGLLQISRTGRVKMTIKKIDMNHLIKTIIMAHNYQITELSAKVIVEDLPDCYGDENQLNQLFSNIIGNAIKYRDKTRQLVIEISCRTQYNKAIYSIKDSGIGIAQRHLGKIWDVFYRVDSALPEAGEGIGLSLAKRIADKHKGKIWAASEEGIGSVFYVELLTNEFTE